MAGWSLRSGRSAGAFMAVGGLGIGVAVAFGAGYTAAHASLSSDSAYVAKGDAVSYVNGDSRTVDGTTKPVAKPGDPTSVVPFPGGAASVDNKTHKITIIRGSTMTPSSTSTDKPSKQQVQLVTSGDVGWIVEPGNQQAIPIRHGRQGKAIHLAVTPDDAAPGSDGSVIVLGTDGTLLRVTPQGATTTLQLAKAPTGALTVAGSHTYLVTGNGQVVEVDDGNPTAVADFGGLQYGNDGRVTAGGLETNGADVLVVSNDSLGIADPTSGQRPQFFSLHAGDDDLGRPVEYVGDAFVPDYTHHDVLRVDEQTGTIIEKLKVPGDASDFALFASGGMLWANDQYSQHLLVVNQQGKVHSVDKGAGNGVSDRKAKRQSDRTKKTPHPPTVPTTSPSTPPTGTGGTGGTPGGTSGGTGGTGGGSGGAGGSSIPKVPVPSISPGTPYQQACSTISAAGFVCDPVAAGQQPGGKTDAVIGTNPKGGTPEPKGSTVTVSYVGPSVVPSFSQDTTPKAACQAITGANLQCDPEPAQSGTTGTFGGVASTNPQSGSSVSSGTKVTVYYIDTFTMPNEVGQPGTAACQKLEQLSIQLPSSTIGVQCTAQVGTQDGTAGQVYQQDPTANAVVTVDGSTAITLTVNDGKINLPDYAGPTERTPQGTPPSGSAAMQDCLQRGFSGCTLITGDPPVTAPASPSWAGDVESTSPGPGDYAPGTPVKIIVYSGDGEPVPNLSGLDPTTACTQLEQAGYACDPQNVPLAPSVPVNNVQAQGQPAGSQPALGTQISYTYTSYQTEAFQQWIDQNSQTTTSSGQPTKISNSNNNVITGGSPPAPPQNTGDSWGDGRLSFAAYAPGTAVPGAVTIDQYSCGAPCGNNSDGLHEYAPAGALPSGMTNDDGPVFVLLPLSNGACPSGQEELYDIRVQQSGSQQQGAVKVYVYSTPQTGAIYNNLIGCAWP